ncbi:pseudouridine synthase [Chitinophaga sp. 212800010-3]|uniref:pseudouridine synthase n=1 Tax=unclassified Chitinophaga TaxID=2619133 RepID=UPI002DF5A673|nr:Pseudouridine synthase [Chitinophaga sp. 212800010-3]
MKKDQPAKKGFSPSKDNRFGKNDKPAGKRSRFSDNGERPGKASAKDSHRDGTFSGKSRFQGEKSGDEKSGFGKRSFNSGDTKFTRGDKSKRFGNDESKTGNSGTKTGRFGADKSRFGADKKEFRKPADGTFKSGFNKDKGFSKQDDNKPAFRRESTDGSGEKPARKRTYGATSTRKNDDSAFHFHGDGKKGANRETPSGFNRKKFFDKTNERFADKQDRKKKIKVRTPDNTGSGDHHKESKESIFGPGEMPLNKYIAHCGLCSRRKAVDFIKEGKVTVNGQLVTEPATKVTNKDVVTMLDKKLQLTKNLLYILLNKPKGYITTTDDPEGRRTVMDLIQEATENERVYPVGRLDRNTSGLLLLTNDGELAQRLAHPKNNIKKIYQVELDKPLTKTDFDKILAGVTLEDGVANVDALGYVDPKDKRQIGIEIHSGKNRIVRRIFEHLEYNVEKLDRVMYAGLTKKTLNRGQWRFLTEKEVILLKHFK